MKKKMMNDVIRLTTIEHRVNKGLIPKDSDIYFLYRLYTEAKNATTTHQSGTDGRTEESVRTDNNERPRQKRLRQRRSVWSGTSNQEDTILEGGE